MKITFILGGIGLSGGDRVIVTLAEYLRRRGHSVLLVWPAAPKRNLKDKIKYILSNGKIPPKYSYVFNYSYLKQPNIHVEYREVSSSIGISNDNIPDGDIVVATFWTTAQWVVNLHPSKGKKIYFIQQYEANFGFPNEKVDATWELPLHKVVCSGWLKQLADERFGDSNVDIVQNGIDTSLFHSPPRQKQRIPTLGFLYAPYAPVKNTALALNVIHAVKSRIPTVQVIAFGALPLDPDAPLPEGSIYFENPGQDELRDIYARCDLWLCTSTSEGFHLPPHEAMACRCPVVSTKVGGPTDLIEHGINGFLCDVNDCNQLSNYATIILSLDNDSWIKMSDAAHRRAIKFTWENAAERFEEACVAYPHKL